MVLRIQLLHRASLRLLQQEKNYWTRFMQQFSRFLYSDKGYYDNYAANVFKIIKCFFNYLQLEKGFITGQYYKMFRVPVQHSAPVVLSPLQLQFLISNTSFDQSLTAIQKRTKDIFVFGCTVALRYTDLMQLKKKHLINLGGETLLVLFTEKTGTEVRIPLPAYALAIIKKHRHKTGRYLLPRLSCTNLNIQIKKLIKLAGWTYQLARYRSKQGKMTELKTATGSSWPFYQQITTHTMRRTAITTLIILGVPENVVRKISGHAPGSREFYKYVCLAQEYLDDAVKKAHQKLIDQSFS